MFSRHMEIVVQNAIVMGYVQSENSQKKYILIKLVFIFRNVWMNTVLIFNQPEQLPKGMDRGQLEKYIFEPLTGEQLVLMGGSLAQN